MVPLSKTIIMSVKNSKQFGIWMDSHHATVVGRKNVDEGDFIVLGHIDNPVTEHNTSEKSEHNDEITLQHKFFKKIAAIMQNVDEVYITGTGDAQEQFIKFLAETPQYKNARAKESTSNKMSDESFIEMITANFN
jgi:stalled ribosome rescue protein Dom34